MELTEQELLNYRIELDQIRSKALKDVLAIKWRQYYNNISKEEIKDDDPIIIKELKMVTQMNNQNSKKYILTINLKNDPSDEEVRAWHERVLNILEKFKDKVYVPNTYLLAFEQRSETEEKQFGYHVHIISKDWPAKSIVLKEWHRRLNKFQSDKNQYDFRVFKGTDNYIKGDKQEKKQAKQLIDNYYRNKFGIKNFYEN